MSKTLILWIAFFLPVGSAVCAADETLRYIDGPVASEDIVHVPGSAWLIASGLNTGQPAHFFLVDTHAQTASVLFPTGAPVMKLNRRIAPQCSGPPDLAKMSTDGVALRAGPHGVHQLYAANHGDRMAIEMFEVNAQGARPSLRWIGCAPLPPHTLPNAVTALRDGGLLVVSFHDPTDPDAWARMARGENTGRVLEWHADRGFQTLPYSEMSGGNGVAMSADESVIYASAWSGRKLIALSLRDGSRHEIPLDFMPDNIHALDDGSLLVGGQRTTVEAVSACNGPSCPQPWLIARVDPRTRQSRDIFKRAGTAAVSYACGGLIVENTLYITVRGDRRIVYVPLSQLPPNP